MKKIKLELDYTEMIALSNGLLQFNFNTVQDTQNLKNIKSILLHLKSKFLVKQVQKKYTKKLYYHEAWAIAQFCEIILGDHLLEIFVSTVYQQIHGKLDKYL